MVVPLRLAMRVIAVALRLAAMVMVVPFAEALRIGTSVVLRSHQRLRLRRPLRMRRLLGPI